MYQVLFFIECRIEGFYVTTNREGDWLEWWTLGESLRPSWPQHFRALGSVSLRVQNGRHGHFVELRAQETFNSLSADLFTS
jgi:hypothetical protein